MSIPSERIQQDLASGIGSSEAAAVLGLDPYRTPLDVWMEKTGQREPSPENRFKKWGKLLEDIVAQAYMEETGKKVRRVNEAKRSPDRVWQLAHLDRVVVGEKRIVEIKTASAWLHGQWGPPGTDEFPDYYKAQVTHQMAVTGIPRADVPVLIGGNDFRLYHYELDPEFLRLLCDLEAEFWFNHVQAQLPPQPMTRSDIEALFAADDGSIVEAGAEAQAACAELKDVKQRLKELEQRKEDLALTVQKEMGPASVMVNAEGKTLVTWKKAKGSATLDKKRLEAEQPELVERYTIVRPGSRRFLVK